MTKITDYFNSLLVVVATLLVIYFIYRSRNKRKYPPSLPWLPIVGSAPFIDSFERLPQFLMKKSKTLGNIFAFYGGSNYTVVLNGRDAINEGLVKKSYDFAGRAVFFAIKEYNLRDKCPGISMRQYDKGFKRTQQNILTIFRDFGVGKSIMEDRISAEVAQLVELLNEKKGEAFECHTLLTSCTINVIYSILFGHRLDSRGSRVIQLVHNNDNLIKSFLPEMDFLPILRFIPRYHRRILHEVEMFHKLDNDLEASVDEALASENESLVRGLVMDYGWKREELPGLLADMMLGGTETGTTTLKWGFVLLANHPAIQERLHKEIDAVVPRDRFPTLNDKAKLPYVEATLLELWRYKTLTPFSIPHITQCDTEVGGYFIPKNAVVIPHIYSAHMDPDTWKDPDVFRPDRFIDDAGDVTGRELVIAFSVGKRTCIGEQLGRQESFLFFSGLLQNFDIRPPEGQKTIDYKEVMTLTVSPAPFDVRLIPRPA